MLECTQCCFRSGPGIAQASPPTPSLHTQLRHELRINHCSSYHHSPLSLPCSLFFSVELGHQRALQITLTYISPLFISLHRDDASLRDARSMHGQAACDLHQLVSAFEGLQVAPPPSPLHTFSSSTSTGTLLFASTPLSPTPQLTSSTGSLPSRAVASSVSLVVKMPLMGSGRLHRTS
jgi:hypothetical protein